MSVEADAVISELASKKKSILERAMKLKDESNALFDEANEIGVSIRHVKSLRLIEAQETANQIGQS